MKPSRVFLVLSLCLLPACAPLHPHTSAWGDAGEVAGRVLLCPATLCFSELILQKEHEAEERRFAYAQWYNGLSREQRDREDARQAAALHALGLALNGGGPFVAPAVVPPPPRSPFLSCTSRAMGTVVYTDCP